jgi:hypothetical protein
MASKIRLSAANPAVANRFVTTANMSLTPYTIANATMPTTPGARRVTVTHTTVAGADTLGVVTITGTDLRGAVITDVITPLAGTVATSTKFFVTVTAAVSTGWVAVSTPDTLVIGAEAGSTVLDGGGKLVAVVVNTTAAGTVAIADGSGTFATLKSSIAEGTYRYDVEVGFLQLTLGAASDVTVIYEGGTIPTTYALA